MDLRVIGFLKILLSIKGLNTMTLAQIAESLEHWRRERSRATYKRRYEKRKAAGQRRCEIRHKRKQRKQEFRRIRRALFH